MNQKMGWGMLLVVALAAGSAWGQCQAGAGGSAGARGSMGGSMARSMGGTNIMSPGSSYGQTYGQAMQGAYAIQQQLALQQYQKNLKDQQQRAERLAQRQYWAAQRREQKTPTPAISSPGSSLAMSLDFSPSK
jgi:hypothetical protein